MTEMKLTMAFLLLSWGAAQGLPLHGTGCAPTAEAAVEQLLANTAGSEIQNGFRVDQVRVDRVRNKSWALVASCADPAKPRIALPLPTDVMNSAIEAQELLVHSGDRVLIVSNQAGSRMQLEGIAEAAGHVHDRIAVRLAPSVMRSQGTPTKLVCEVVKAHIVEVIQ